MSTKQYSNTFTNIALFGAAIALNPILSAALIGGLIGYADALIGIRNKGCDEQNGRWYGSDLCK